MRKENVSKTLRLLITLFGAAIGGGLAALGIRIYSVFFPAVYLSSGVAVTVCALITLLFAAIFWLCSRRMIAKAAQWRIMMEGTLSEMPLSQILSGTLGLILGLVIAAIVSQLFRAGLPDLLWAGLSAVVHLTLGYFGASICAARWRELPAMFTGSKARAADRRATMPRAQDTVGKILDTSVIIDGRIFDVCKTGFIEGPLIIPQFVLAELRHIADSSDPLRRNRGRRGLDVLARIQKELDILVQITDADFDDVEEVDVKLLKLARQISGVVVTNDFNLNKVADVTGVKVLNVNELAGALRPVLLPGEEMRVQILREGKEHGQGIGYLDDGTMIVVDNGRRYIGETIDVVVTTVLQTSAGRMIFTKMKQAA